MTPLAWIDDDIDVFSHLKKHLTEAGYQVFEYHSYAEATGAMAEIAKCSVILVDVILTPGRGGLPEGETSSRGLGLRFLREFRERHGAAVPAVVLSVVGGNADLVPQEELSRLNATAIPKFSSLNEILDRIRSPHV